MSKNRSAGDDEPLTMAGGSVLVSKGRGAVYKVVEPYAIWEYHIPAFLPALRPKIRSIDVIGKGGGIKGGKAAADIDVVLYPPKEGAVTVTVYCKDAAGSGADFTISAQQTLTKSPGKLRIATKGTRPNLLRFLRYTQDLQRHPVKTMEISSVVVEGASMAEGEPSVKQEYMPLAGNISVTIHYW